MTQTQRILLWVCVVIWVAQLGFGSIIPVVALYADGFGVSATAIGLTIAIYGAARVATNVPTGRIADRFGRPVALAAGGALTVVGNLICGLSESYLVFLGGRFIAGAGGAMAITGTQIIVTDISTIANRGRMLGIYQATFLFAVGLGPIPGGLLADAISLSAPFFVYSGLGGVAALVAWGMIPDTRALSTNPAPADVPPTLAPLPQLRLLLRHRGFGLVALVSFMSAFGRTGALFGLIPVLAQSRLGISPAQIGVGLGLVSLVGLTLAYPSGVLSDRFGRKTVIAPGAIGAGVGMVAFALMPDYPSFLLACALWALATGLAGSSPAAYAADVAPPGMNAAALGSYRMLADLGYVLGPLLIGLAADLIHERAALYLTASLLLAAGLLFALLAPEPRSR